MLRLLAATTTAFALLTTSAGAALHISELRLRGPDGAYDEFVELGNRGPETVTVQTSDGSPGYAVVAEGGTIKFVIPNGTVIPPGGHYLGTGSAYSLGGATAGDRHWQLDIPDNSGVALFTTVDAQQFDEEHRLDAFGFTTSDPLYREGPGFPPIQTFSTEMSFLRSHARGRAQDTGDNFADFLVPDTGGIAYLDSKQLLGAPGPQDSLSPRSTHGGLEIGLLDPAKDAGASPNMERDNTSNPPKATFGAVIVRRVITNRTGAAIKRLRLRVGALTTFPAPSGAADLRPITSPTQNIDVAGTPVTVRSAALLEPPDQPSGGGVNSVVSVTGIGFLDPLYNGESIAVQIRLGVQKPGDFRACLYSESLPVPTGSVLDAAGNTETTGSVPPGCVTPPLLPPGDDEEDEAPPQVTPTGTTESAPPAAQPEAPAQPQPQRDTVAPRFVGGGIALSARRFTRRRGTRIRFALDEAATVTFRVQRRRGRRFVALPGSFSATAKAGANSLRFKGRLAGRVLGRARYRLVAVAVDAAGNRSLPARRRFRIVPPR
jgi:hypothetical protein